MSLLAVLHWLYNLMYVMCELYVYCAGDNMKFDCCEGKHKLLMIDGHNKVHYFCCPGLNNGNNIW